MRARVSRNQHIETMKIYFLCVTSADGPLYICVCVYQAPCLFHYHHLKHISTSIESTRAYIGKYSAPNTITYFGKCLRIVWFSLNVHLHSMHFGNKINFISAHIPHKIALQHSNIYVSARTMLKMNLLTIMTFDLANKFTR